jgi:PadR family transcriptional regulator, regulatory protein PadR
MNDETRAESTESRQAQLFKGLAELALKSLLQERPHYGLEILERLRSEAGLGLAEGTIYPLLHRLEKAKLMIAHWRLEEEGARPRKYYELTPLGERDLKAQLQAWRKLSSDLGSFLDRKKT